MDDLQHDRWTRSNGYDPEWINYDELYRTGITGNLRTG